MKSHVQWLQIIVYFMQELEIIVAVSQGKIDRDPIAFLWKGLPSKSVAHSSLSLQGHV